MGEYDDDVVLRWVEESVDPRTLVDMLVGKYNVIDYHELIERLEDVILELSHELTKDLDEIYDG